MAYDEQVAQRIRHVLGGQPGLEEKKMFGGLAFMLNGHMCCGVMQDGIMVRVGPEGHDAAVSRPHASEMDFTGRPMRGMVTVKPAGFAAETALAEWVELGRRFALTQPPKVKAAKAKSPKAARAGKATAPKANAPRKT